MSEEHWGVALFGIVMAFITGFGSAVLLMMILSP